MSNNLNMRPDIKAEIIPGETIHIQITALEPEQTPPINRPASQKTTDSLLKLRNFVRANTPAFLSTQGGDIKDKDTFNGDTDKELAQIVKALRRDQMNRSKLLFENTYYALTQPPPGLLNPTEAKAQSTSWANYIMEFASGIK